MHQTSPLSFSLFATLILHLSSQPTAAAAASLLTRQYEDGSYAACAKACFEPAVDTANCPFDASGTRNACLCRDTAFWTDFMTCTFRSCGGEVLAQTAQTAVGNCEGTSTPSVWNVDTLLSVGQGGAGGVASSSPAVVSPSAVSSVSPSAVSSASSMIASTAPSTFITIPSATSAAPSSTPTSVQPSPVPTTSPSSPTTAPIPTFTTSNTPSGTSSPSADSSPSSGLNTAAIIGIAIGGLSALSALIFGIHQWRTRPPGDRAVRDVGSWFCGCGRHRNYNETPMVMNPRRNR